MSLRMPGGTLVRNTVVNPATKQIISTFIEDSLVTAGWSVISGSHTGDVLIQSATTPAPEGGMAMRLRIKTDSTNCCSLQSKTITNTLESSKSAFINPDLGKTYAIYCNKYSGFVGSITPAKELDALSVACFGVGYLPPWEVPDANMRAFLHGNANSDSDGTSRGSFRSNNGMINAGATGSTHANGVVANTTTGGDGGQFIQVTNCSAGVTGSWVGKRWNGQNYVNGLDAVVCWSPTNSSATTGRKMVQLYGAMWLEEALNADEEFICNGFKWRAFTHQNTNTTGGGTLMVAVAPA